MSECFSNVVASFFPRPDWPKKVTTDNFWKYARNETISPLEEMALTQVVISLFQSKVIQSEIQKVYFYYCKPAELRDSLWENVVETSVRNMKLELNLPDCFDEIMWDLIRSIGYEIFRWLETLLDLFPFYFFKDINIYLRNISWTAFGTIHCPKTVSLLLKDPNMIEASKFMLACSNCVEKTITAVKGNVPDVTCISPVGHPFGVKDFLRVTYWTSYMVSDFTEFETVLRDYNREFRTDENVTTFMLNNASKFGDECAFHYFWSCLSDDEKKKRIAKAMASNTPNITARLLCQDRSVWSRPNIICYLLSQASESQQKEYLQKHIVDLLCCLARDPHWMKVFLPTMLYYRHFITASKGVALLNGLVRCLYSPFPGYAEDYRHFLTVFLNSSLLFQGNFYFTSDMINELDGAISFLFHLGELDLIEQVVNLLSGEDRSNLVLSVTFIMGILLMVYHEEWDAVEKLMGYAFSLEADLQEFKMMFNPLYQTSAVVEAAESMSYKLGRNVTERLTSFCYTSKKFLV